MLHCFTDWKLNNNTFIIARNRTVLTEMRVGLLTVCMQEPSMPAHDPEYILSWAVSFYIYVYLPGCSEWLWW